MPSIKEKELIAQACINLSGKLGGSEVSSAMSRNRILDSTISVADTTFGVIAKSVVMSSNMSFTGENGACPPNPGGSIHPLLR